MSEEQREYIADNVSSLALAGVIREAGFHVFSFGIYKEEEPIWFAMIGYDIPYICRTYVRELSGNDM